MASVVQKEFCPQATCLIRAGLQSQILLPSDSDYNTCEESYFSNTAKLKPACITQIRHPQRRPRPLAGSNNIHGGVTIDLSLLNSVRFGSASEAVSFGPGVRWKHVYVKVQKHGRVVAGLLLRGGNTWMTARKGFACDNVVALEVVLADGLIGTADRNTHADLFRALKGGSNNFGIVVGFTMSTIPCQSVWGGSTASPNECIPDAIRITGYFTKRVVENPDSNLTRPKSDTWFTLTVKIDERIMPKAAEVHDGLVEELKSYVPDFSFIIQCIFQPLPLAFARHAVAAGGNVLGLERNTSDGILLQTSTMVKTLDQREFAYPRVKACIRAVDEYTATINGGILEWLYLNYADESQDVLRSYGLENVEFMRAVSRKYDPQQIFQYFCPGGFKLLGVML
ncbi:hypothetical protein DL764_006099 [Monosporascus ibericus]|uniref:FAD linked oxidase N-terminal domain-containing protein n=1 Tax=Monosporascus ibericus TaxID=155417 RepID=A0A4Q4T963_9PEZI|nr:hypothetical protein DL764_006099 [Monosporascus ibericus]